MLQYENVIVHIKWQHTFNYKMIDSTISTSYVETYATFIREIYRNLLFLYCSFECQFPLAVSRHHNDGERVSESGKEGEGEREKERERERE
jgi:hypothetical protein